VIFGGRSIEKKALKDAWGLRHHKDGRWDWVKAPYSNDSVSPSSRYQHSVFFYGATLMFVYGGRGDNPNKTLDLDVYDTETSKWLKV
jgi:protein phosphatase